MKNQRTVEEPTKLILVSEKVTEKNAHCWECKTASNEIYKVRFPPFEVKPLYCKKCLERFKAEKTEKGKPKYFVDWKKTEVR